VGLSDTASCCDDAGNFPGAVNSSSVWQLTSTRRSKTNDINNKLKVFMINIKVGCLLFLQLDFQRFPLIDQSCLDQHNGDFVTRK
jgi:hypothetical protein